MTGGKQRSAVRLSVVFLGLAALALSSGFFAPVPQPTSTIDEDEFDPVDVFSLGVYLDEDGNYQPIEPGDQVYRVSGTSSLEPKAAEEQQEWLERGTIPGPAQYRGMATQALLDLQMLMSVPGSKRGAAVAAPHGIWQYVWPRDSSFMAVALARTGHGDDARDILRFLRSVQRPDGQFEARYLPDASGVPDDRLLQMDGCGWTSWAVWEWYEAEKDAGNNPDISEFMPMVLGCFYAVERRVDPATGLPDASPDYWEVPEDSPTLGSTAALLLGARMMNKIMDAGDAESDVRFRAQILKSRLESGIAQYFEPAGFPRRLTGPPRDAAITFLMPPFTSHASEAVMDAWEGAVEIMGRPAGGIAPGESWPNDGVSWTPQTSLAALVAASSGDHLTAQEWLTWIDDHRTPLGSIPEKVQSDGSPGAVAPLGWSAAVVLVALTELDSGPGNIPLLHIGSDVE